MFALKKGYGLKKNFFFEWSKFKLPKSPTEKYFLQNIDFQGVPTFFLHYFSIFRVLCEISQDNDTIDDSSEQNIKVQYGEDFEIQGNNNAGEEDGDVITISESLAKSHFPELLETPQEVYEISNTEGIDGFGYLTKITTWIRKLKKDQAKKTRDIV